MTPKPARRDFDILTGERIRLHRLLLNMSQLELAEKIGVSYQQVQRYERGLNRLSAAMLISVAAALGLPLTYFFPDAETEQDESPVRLIDTQDGLAALRAYRSIRSAKVRFALLELIKAFAAPKD